jgi:hypothetical protein
MSIHIKLSSLGQTQLHEYVIRFILGGLVTAATGWVTNKFGPQTGGIFLAFPSIFFASATLIEKHERQRKERIGVRGARRGKGAAALDAAGAALGSFGLMAFALIVWTFGVMLGTTSLVVALAAWGFVSVLLWTVRRKLMCKSARNARNPPTRNS